VAATQDCYSGPEGSKDVGICKGGTQTCQQGGTWGDCTGQVTPQTENPKVADDEDCNGEASSAVLWAKRFGDAGEQTVTGVATDKDGNIVFVGAFSSTIDLGGGTPHTSKGLHDIYVAKLDGNGDYLWSKSFGDAMEQEEIQVAIDKDGNVILGGSFQGTVDFGGGPLESAGSNDVFVAKLDKDGSPMWSKRFGNDKNQTLESVAVGPAGEIAIAGGFEATIDFGSGGYPSNGSLDAFIVKLNELGGSDWTRRVGSGAYDVATSVAIDADGNVIGHGKFTGTVTVGDTMLTSAGFEDLFLAKYDSMGAVLWANRYGTTIPDGGGSVIATAQKNIALCGFIQGDIDFGGGDLTGVGNVYVAESDAAGAHQWSSKFGGLGNEVCGAIAADAASNIVFGGAFFESADFGGGTLANAGDGDIYVVKLDAEGKHVWSRRFGDAALQRPTAITTDSTGHVIVAGRFDGSVDFDGQTITSLGNNDAFITKIAP